MGFHVTTIQDALDLTVHSLPSPFVHIPAVSTGPWLRRAGPLPSRVHVLSLYGALAILLVTSGGHDWRLVETFSLEDLTIQDPTGADI